MENSTVPVKLTNISRGGLMRASSVNTNLAAGNLSFSSPVLLVLKCRWRQLKSSYFKRLYNVFDGDNVRSFKIICPECRRVNILKACSC